MLGNVNTKLDEEIIQFGSENIDTDDILSILQEECSELIHAISKYNRANGKGMPTWCSKEEAYHNLIQEFTDVMIDLNQLARMMNWDEETFKPYKMKALDDINRRYDEAGIRKNLKAFREGKFNTNAKG